MSKTVLITGCSEGSLGSAMAIAFAARGHRTIATARSPAKLTHLNSHANITTATLDVNDGASIAACVASLSTSLPRLDILINNAGALYAMPLSDADPAAAKRLFDLNVWAALAVTQAFLPLLLKSGGGVVVNQTSISSVVPVPWNGVYSASKAALAALTDALRLELAPFGVRVVELKTGAVRSNFYRNRNFGDCAGGEKGTAEMETTLPPGSLYEDARAVVESAMAGAEVQDGAMAADVWARKVVDAVLTDRPARRVWLGKNAFAVWFAKRFMPSDFLDGNMRKLGRLEEVESIVAARRPAAV